MVALAPINVISRTVTAQPASPNEGDFYIVPLLATGTDWSTYSAFSLAHFADGAWEQIAPSLEQVVIVLTENKTLSYKGSPRFWADVSLGFREVLTGARTYYVRAAGNDSTGDGLTVGTAVNSISKAIALAASIDTAGFTVTIDAIETRTHTTGIVLKALTGGGSGVITGNGGASGLSIISTAGAALGDAAVSAGAWFVDGFKLVSATYDVYAVGAFTQLAFGSDMWLAASAGYHIVATYGSTVSFLSGLKVSGAAPYLASILGGSKLTIGGPVVLVGTPAFTTCLTASGSGSVIVWGASSVTGTATGTPWQVDAGGYIAQANASIPGSTAPITRASGIFENTFSDPHVRAPIRNQFIGSGSPNSGHDADDGFAPGSVWVDLVADAYWVCVDATAGAAIWQRLAPTFDGTWTPVLTFGSPGDLNAVYTTQVGSFVKNGRLVVASFNIVTSTFTFTTATGNLNISGLPFPSDSTSGFVAKGSLDFQGVTMANFTQFTPTIAPGSSLITVVASAQGQSRTTTSVSHWLTGTNKTLIGTISYFTPS